MSKQEVKMDLAVDSAGTEKAAVAMEKLAAATDKAAAAHERLQRAQQRGPDDRFVAAQRSTSVPLVFLPKDQTISCAEIPEGIP